MSPLFAGRASAAAVVAICVVSAGTASAQCVDIEEGDVLVADLTANKIIRLTDVDLTADPNANQEVVCVGEDETAQPRVLFPRSLDNDREGRLWISMNNNVVRADPAADTQVTVMPGPLSAPPRGIVKQKDGDVFLAWPALNSLGYILQVDRLYGGFSYFASENSGVAFPLGLIFDPSTGALPGEMLLASSRNLMAGEKAGAYRVLSNGGVIPIAQHGFIASPERIASKRDRFIYLSDQGGSADPDGPQGPELPVTRPPQVIQVDRTITIDFNDPAANFKANQKLISEGGLLDVPIGIVLLDADGEGLDSVLVASGGSVLGDGLVLRIDFDPDAADPSATSTQTLISQGQNFLNPWGLHIVEGIDPLPKEPLYVTDVSTADEPGVFLVDPTGAAAPPPPPSLATGAPFVRPNGIVADPDNADLLLVADGGLPGVIEVNVTNGATSIVSQDDLLQEPMNVIVDASGDLIVTDNGAPAIIRVDRGTGTQSIVSPLPSEKNFLQSPVSTGIQPDGFLLVSDQGTGNTDGRLIIVSPATGKQWCTAEGVVIAPGGFAVFSIDGIQDLSYDENDSFVFDIDSESAVPILRLDALTEPVIFGESASPEYVTPRGLAFAENRDILTVDAGTSSGDGRVLRLDPLLVEPTVVPNSTGLGDPFGVALAGKPRPNPGPPDDTDGDGVLDLEDNCVDTPNPDQLDTNGNCIGDTCDTGCYAPNCPITCDRTGDGSVGGPDFTLIIDQLGRDCTPEGVDTDCTADCTGDDRVGGPDFSLLVAEIGNELAGSFGILVSLDPVGPCTDPDPGPGPCTIPSP